MKILKFKQSFLIAHFLLFLFLFSCYEERDEFAGIEIPDSTKENPLGFLGEAKNIEDSRLRGQSNTNNALYVFDNTYKDINNWGAVRFSQKDVTLEELEGNTFTNLLYMSRKVKEEKKFLPVDMRIGNLQWLSEINYADKKIIDNINDFFNLMKQKSLDKKIDTLVIDSELAIISRQVARAVEFGPEITEVRIGEIKPVDQSQRRAAVRVIRKSPSFESRALYQFYFVQLDGNWLINAIEGDFQDLLVEYKNPGEFVPLGTTGVTQGF